MWRNGRRHSVTRTCASAARSEATQAGGDQVVEVAEVERLGDVPEGAIPDRVDGDGELVVARHYDDRDGLIDLHDLLERLDAVHARHVDIQEDDVRTLLRDDGERIEAVRCGVDFIL